MRYLTIEEIKFTAQKVFEEMHSFFDENHSKRYPIDYTFAETTLGAPLLDFGSVEDKLDFGDVNKEVYWDHSAAIDKIKAEADRSWWGTLVTAVLNDWQLDVNQVHMSGKRALRYIEFNEAVRTIGHEALYRENVPPTADDIERAQYRFSLSTHLSDNDKYGIDFFVSHNWLDENAPQRWNAMVSISDLFQNRYGRLPRFWLDRFCIDQSNSDDIALKVKLLPVTVMSCKQMLVLHSPRYMGCTSPRTDASLWCIVELYTATSLAKPDSPTGHIMWLSIFEGRIVPPPIDLLHGKV